MRMTGARTSAAKLPRPGRTRGSTVALHRTRLPRRAGQAGGHRIPPRRSPWRPAAAGGVCPENCKWLQGDNGVAARTDTSSLALHRTSTVLAGLRLRTRFLSWLSWHRRADLSELQCSAVLGNAPASWSDAGGLHIKVFGRRDLVRCRSPPFRKQACTVGISP